MRDWLARGAQPSQTVRKLLRIHGSSPADGAAGERDGNHPSVLSVPAPRACVDDPEQVEVERFEEDDGTVVLELAVGRRRLRQGDRPRRPYGRTRCAPS